MKTISEGTDGVVRPERRRQTKNADLYWIFWSLRGLPPKNVSLAAKNDILCDAAIPIRRPGRHTLEQCKHGAHILDLVGRGDEMHLRCAGIGKTNVDAGIDQCPYQALRCSSRLRKAKSFKACEWKSSCDVLERAAILLAEFFFFRLALALHGQNI